MKKITYLLLIGLCTFLVSCGEDDSSNLDADVDEIDSELLMPLIGNWTATSVTATGCSNSDDNGENTCGDLTFCLFLQITDEGLYGLADNTDPELGEITNGIIKSLTSTTLLLCQPGLFGEEEECTNTITYSVTNSNSLSITYTDDDKPGCTFRATLTKDS